MNTVLYIQAIAGLLLLVGGADLMVRGSEKLARRFGISQLVVGLTIVAFGTSAPELAISIRAGLAGQGDIALGNVVGSNILNVLLILGLSAIITPLVVDNTIIRREVPILITASAALLFMAFDDQISRIDGLLLFSSLIVYIAWLIKSTQHSSDGLSNLITVEHNRTNPLLLTGMCIVGLVLLILGANMLVESAVSFARHLGVSELLIGLTIISIGTSLPEIATSLVAAFRGMRDLAVGNVVGSCLFNILAVAGLASLIAPEGLGVAAALIKFDLPIMLATAIACLPIFATGNMIARWEGLLFLFYYLVYMAYLVLAPQHAETAQMLNTAMLVFVLPLTFITLFLLWHRQKQNS